jgi:hypothetical protein
MPTISRSILRLLYQLNASVRSLTWYRDSSTTMSIVSSSLRETVSTFEVERGNFDGVARTTMDGIIAALEADIKSVDLEAWRV